MILLWLIGILKLVSLPNYIGGDKKVSKKHRTIDVRCETLKHPLIIYVLRGVLFFENNSL
jgi:hypothetical protein